MSFICHIHNYTEYNEEWNVFSAFNPSKWSSGQPTLQRPGEQLGVRCLAQGSHLSHGHFLPEPGFEPTTLGYLGFQVQCSIHYATTAIFAVIEIKQKTARSWLAKIWCKTNSTKSKRKFSCFHVFSNFQSLLKISKMFWQSTGKVFWSMLTCYLATCLCELIKMKHSVYLVKKFKPGAVL